ncbi:ribosomal-processing cysteine protease Prp [Anaerocolumna sedimenticola]|uniref:Ribosomal processing cysteine protease Prp n=1 Tax=Anaerocolumna sedimenticola TaxID=2696063 RepID=A0A6P1TJV7_9FIRM|nr:ribosomal-processing cysteine protease Prp [Anaerocolumna sedimenticola]QHQ61384.1 ribosomal-processing cysteine protease Prp [Anaerocolumna sedimenticola]
MTQITELYRDNELIGFRVGGHANYSIPGRDIVCAAISALTINTINSIGELSDAEMEIQEGLNGNIQYCVVSKPDIITHTLLKAALIGYKNIAEQYPENVSIVERR